MKFYISIHDDDKLEINEEFSVSINPGSLPDRVTRGSPEITRIIIVNDDGESMIVLITISVSI